MFGHLCVCMCVCAFGGRLSLDEMYGVVEAEMYGVVEAERVQQIDYCLPLPHGLPPLGHQY